jgi:hypothetical protein
MTVKLSAFAGAGAQFFDDNGNPLAGGFIHSYAAGTTTPQATFTTSLGNIQNSNPIVLDATGRTPDEIWLTEAQVYKFAVYTSSNVLIGTYDNIPGINDVKNQIDDVYANFANTSNPTKGDALVGFRQSNSSGNLTGAVGRTVHQKLQEFVSVLDFGADPLGLTDSTAAVQAATDAVHANGGGTIYFPTGTYLVTMVNAYAGIIYQGSGGAVIKRPANQPNFTRTFTFNPTTAWSESYDSPPIQFLDLIIDGNRDNQGPYSAYQQEQSHLIFLVADATKAGRLRAIIEGCTFLNCVADAISVYENVDVSVDNCFVQNAFRGGFVLTGGFTRFRVSNLVIKGTVQSRGIDFEIDGPGFGGDFRTTGTMTNVETNGCFDVSIGNNSRITVSNITYGDVSEYAVFNVQSISNAQFNLSNSSFILIGGANLRQIRFSEDLRIDNCSFLFSNATSTGTVSLLVYAEDFRNLMVNNCRFGVATGSNLGPTFYALEFTAGNSSDHKAKISDCYFSPDFDSAVACIQGGYVSMNDCFIDCTTGLTFGGSGSFPFYGEMVDCSVGIYNTTLWTQLDNNTGVSLYVAGSIEATDYAVTTNGTNWNYKSGLTVFGTDANPNTAPVFGLPNDVYKQKGFPTYGSSGTPVMYVGSYTAGPAPNLTWVPINRD